MKKLLFGAVLIALLALPFSVSFGFEANSYTGFGLLSQKGQSSQFSFDIGVDVPLVTAGNGWLIKNTTTAFYSDRDAGELQAFKTMALTQKSLFYGKAADSSMAWDFHVGLGTGMWRFVNTAGEDVSRGAYSLLIGGLFKGVSGDFGIDAIQLDGPDMYYTYFGIGIKF